MTLWSRAGRPKRPKGGNQCCKLQIRPRDHFSTSLVDTARGQDDEQPFMHSESFSIRTPLHFSLWAVAVSNGCIKRISSGSLCYGSKVCGQTSPIREAACAEPQVLLLSALPFSSPWWSRPEKTCVKDL
jgi:hypothetical protein